MTDPIQLLRDVEQGAEAYLSTRTTTDASLTSVQKAARNMFFDAVQEAIDNNEAQLHVFALLLTGEHRKAMDVLREYVAPEESDMGRDAREWDNAADRGNDAREA